MRHIHRIAAGRRLSIELEDTYSTEPSHIQNSPPSSFLARLHATSSNSLDIHDKKIHDLVSRSWKGLSLGVSPTLCEEGVGGTYFLRDPESQRPIGVFKPQDEEMGGTFNPKGFTPSSGTFRPEEIDRRGVLAGEAAFHECAAYILDHDHFSDVPATDILLVQHPAFSLPRQPIRLSNEDGEELRIGSFQEFKEHDFDAHDISPAKASKFPIKEVHKIAILDIRLFNTDRHGGNILVKQIKAKKSKPEYTPTPPSTPIFTPLLNHKRTSPSKKKDYASPSLTYSDSSYDSSSPSSSPLSSDEEDLSSRIRALNTNTQFEMELSDLDLDGDDDKPDGNDDSDDECYTLTKPRSDSSSITYKLIPIDHGYTLPSCLSGLCNAWPEWLWWPQAKVPFDEESLAYIARLDPDKDAALLRERLGNWISDQSLKVLKISTTWLQIGAKIGLTPYDICTVMCRKVPEQPSQLEEMVATAEQFANYSTEWVIGMKASNLKEEKQYWSPETSRSMKNNNSNSASSHSTLNSDELPKDGLFFSNLFAIMESTAKQLFHKKSPTKPPNTPTSPFSSSPHKPVNSSYVTYSHVHVPSPLPNNTSTSSNLIPVTVKSNNTHHHHNSSDSPSNAGAKFVPRFLRNAANQNTNTNTNTTNANATNLTSNSNHNAVQQQLPQPTKHQHQQQQQQQQQHTTFIPSSPSPSKTNSINPLSFSQHRITSNTNNTTTSTPTLPSTTTTTTPHHNNHTHTTSSPAQIQRTALLFG